MARAAGPRLRGSAARSRRTECRRPAASRWRPAEGRTPASAAQAAASKPSARAVLPEPGRQVGLHPLLEQTAVEGLSAEAQLLGLEPVPAGLEALDRLRERLHGLTLEEETGGRLRAPGGDHRLERASLPEGDDRPSRGHGLERRDPEVLERREDQRAAAGVERRDLGVVAPAEQLHGGTCHGPQPTLLDRKSTRLNSSHLGISYAV